MARTLMPASHPGLLLTANQDHVLEQSPILKPTQLRMDDDTQAALLEQALALLSAAEKRLADQRDRIAYLETMAMTDVLTNLPNRREFEHTLLRTLATARRYVESGALAFIDLDNFKTVNDTLGHEAGDCVLVHVAELLSENVRAADLAARLGGDEFVVLMVRTAPEEAIKRARELQSVVNNSYATFDATRIYVRASFGTVPYGPDSEAAELLNQADEAMYQDKKYRALPEPVVSATSEAHSPF